MCINKTILPDKGICRITFTLKDTLVDHPKEAAIVGDFNNWDPQGVRMNKSPQGYFEQTVELPAGRDYQFRYLVNRVNWENDWQADAYAPTPFCDSYNMVISCELPEET